MSASLALIARLAIAAVFALAAWTKLTDRQGTRNAIAAFGGRPPPPDRSRC